MNFISRVQGVFFNPRIVFEHLSEKPLWGDVLILILVAVMAFTYLTAPFQQQDQAKIMENNTRLRERLGESRFEEMMEDLRTPNPARRLIGTGMAPVLLTVGFMISSLFLMIFGRMFSSQGRFVDILAAVVHANLIDKLLGNALRLILILSRKSFMQTSTGLAMFFPKLEATSTAYIILTQIDFFQLWMFAVLGIGLARIFKIEPGKAMALSYGFWLLKTALTVGITLVGMSFMG